MLDGRGKVRWHGCSLGERESFLCMPGISSLHSWLFISAGLRSVKQTYWPFHTWILEIRESTWQQRLADCYRVAWTLSPPPSLLHNSASARLQRLYPGKFGLRFVQWKEVWAWGPSLIEVSDLRIGRCVLAPMCSSCVFYRIFFCSSFPGGFSRRFIWSGLSLHLAVISWSQVLLVLPYLASLWTLAVTAPITWKTEHGYSTAVFRPRWAPPVRLRELEQLFCLTSLIWVHSSLDAPQKLNFLLPVGASGQEPLTPLSHVWQYGLILVVVQYLLVVCPAIFVNKAWLYFRVLAINNRLNVLCSWCSCNINLITLWVTILGSPAHEPVLRSKLGWHYLCGTACVCVCVWREIYTSFCLQPNNGKCPVIIDVEAVLRVFNFHLIFRESFHFSVLC